MSDFTTVDSSIISDMKRLSKDILELEEMFSFGMGNHDLFIKLRDKKNDLRQLIEKL